MGGSSQPCASCKLLRRRCTKECIFAAYFPSDDPCKFAIVHKVFGASNVSKMLQELPMQQRGDAVSSLVYEATARTRDPVYGCVGAISYLQSQVSHLQMQLAVAQTEILCIQLQQQQEQEEPNLLMAQDGGAPQFLGDPGGDQDNHKLNDDFVLENSISNNTGGCQISPHHMYCTNYASYSGSNIAEDPLKREFLWT